MAVEFVKNHTVASNKTAGTTLAVALDTAVPAGSLIVLRAVYDNAATASKPLISSVGRAAGETNTWATALGSNSTSTSAGLFSSGGMTWILTTVAWPAASYTVTLDTSTVQKAMAFQEFTGVLATQRSTAGTAYSTTTTAALASTTGTTPVIGDLTIGFMFQSNATTAGSDTDTTGGSWNTALVIGSTGGSAATNNAGLACFKILTTASHQFLSQSAGGIAGNGSIVTILQAAPEPSITQAAYQFFDDAGTESGAASLAAQNTAIPGNIANGDGLGMIRVRLQAGANAGFNTDDYQLQWEKNASGTWSSVAPAGEALSDNYPTSNFNANVSIGKTSALTMIGQSFTGDGKLLTRVDFQLAKVNTPTGNLTAQLFAHSGTFGTSSIATGAALATSTAVPASAISSQNVYSFVFDGTYSLVNGTNYVIAISVPVNTSVNYFDVGVDTSSPTHAGNRCAFGSGTWTATATEDTIFMLYTTPSVVVGYDNPNLTEGAVTTNRLTGGTGTFVAGKVAEDGHVDNVYISGNNYTEILYSVKVLAAQVVNGDTIRFRVLRNGVTTQMTYTQTPTLNIVDVAVTQAAYRFYSDGTETGSTALAAQDTSPTINPSADTAVQLRTRLQLTNAAATLATDDWQLQWEKNANGTWTNVVAVGTEALYLQYDETNNTGSSQSSSGSTRHEARPSSVTASCCPSSRSISARPALRPET